MRNELTERNRQRRSDLRWGIGFLIGGIVLAALGEPRPLGHIAAVASLLTGAYLMFRRFDP